MLQTQKDIDKVLLYVNSIETSFQEAAGNVNVVEKFYCIGNHYFCLKFAGEELLTYIPPAISHLEIKDKPEDFFTINIWDALSAKVNLPEPIWEMDFIGEKNERWGFDRNDIIGLFIPENQSFQVIQKSKKNAYYFIPSAEQIHFSDVASPLRSIFNWYFKDNNRQLIHGAAVAHGNDGILLAGHNNAGKTSTALTCIRSGFNYAGDDNVLLDTNSEQKVYSLYNTAKLFEKDFEFFPNLKQAVNNLAENIYGKSLIFLDKLYFKQLKSSFQIKAVVIPNVTDKDFSEIKPISPAKSLLLLAPNSIFILDGDNNSSLKNIAAFIKKVPNFILNLGKDRKEIPLILRDMVKNK